MKDRNIHKKIATWIAFAASIVLVLCLICHIAVMASFKLFLIFEYATMPRDEYFHYTVTLHELPVRQSAIYNTALYKNKNIPMDARDKLSRYVDEIFFTDEHGNEWFQIRGVDPTEMLLFKDSNGYLLFELDRYLPKTKEEIYQDADTFYQDTESQERRS